MLPSLWKRLFAALPPNLTLDQACRIFRRSPCVVRRYVKATGYPLKRRAKYAIPEWAEQADWSRPNIEIAQQFRITRERVRQFRKKLNKPKIESRGRKPGTNGKNSLRGIRRGRK